MPFLASGIGTVGIILAIRAVADFKRLLANGWFWLCTAFFSIGIIYGIPPFSWLGYLYPFSVSYNYKYAQPILNLSLAILAGIGFSLFLEKDNFRKDLLILGLVWLWAMINLLIALLDGFKPFYAFGATIQIGWLLVVIIIFSLAMVLKKSFPLQVPAFLILICLLVGFYLDRNWGRGRDESGYLFSQLKEARALKNMVSGLWRFSAENDILFPNILLVLGIDDVRVYDPLYPKSYVYFISAVEGLKSKEEINTHYQKHKLFQISRKNISSGLAYLLNLGIYASERELNSQLIYNSFLEGEKIGLFSDWTRVEPKTISNITKKALLLHSPIRINADILTLKKKFELKFETGYSGYGDGAEFMLLEKTNSDYRLTFYRYIAPTKKLSERKWFGFKYNFKKTKKEIKFALIGLPGPKGDYTNDYLAWAGLRLFYPELKSSVIENLVEEGAEISINHIQNFFPRYFLVQGVGIILAKGLKDGWKFFLKLRDLKPGYFRNQAIVFEPVQYKQSFSKTKERSYVKVLSHYSQKVELEVKAPNDCFLLASDQYFPGWRAEIDGKEQRIYRADLALRLIFIPTGKHIVKFWYEPISFKIGLWSSLAGIFLMLGLVILKFIFKR